MRFKISAFAFLFVSLLALEAFAAPQKVCLDPDTGRIRAKRNCSGFFTRELTNANTVHGQLLTVTADETATLVAASAHVIGPITHTGTGLYLIDTTISDTSLCTITVSQALGSAGGYVVNAGLIAYPNVGNLTQIGVDTVNPAGTPTDVGFSVIAHCPSGI